MNIPAPSRFIKHDVIDEIATELNRKHREGATRDLCFDVESFAENVLEKKVVWEPIPEPSNRVCFASITLEQITINERHRSLFTIKPFLVRSCLSHEIGHHTLGHLELLRENENRKPLSYAHSG